ncbi:MAG: arylsulfatase [Candidatus Latescibacterota bacterium]|nr:MAG: arylsulfatase [Candidatus Latescibacterota bacterium]
MEGRPNVLVVFTDQQRWDTVGCYGNPMDLTPNLDRMAERGVTFQHAFTCQPVCGPARASLQTGKYATKVGVWKNHIPLPEGERTLAHHFKEAGYRVGYIGKWHLAATGEKPVPPELRGGYDFWEAADVLEFTSHPYDTVLYDVEGREVRVSGYRVDALTERAINFIRDGGEPFFLFLSYLEPHQQNDWNRFVAPEGYAERYANPYVPPDLKAFPGDWFQHLPDYYGMVARIDECLGKLTTTLEELGISERTIVVFTSDHGCHFRTRNTEYKRSCHESSIRIPLVIRGPGFEGPKVVRELVSLVDVAPTLLEAAGIPVPPEVQGRSLMPLVRGEADGWRNEVFVQISEYLVGRAVRTPRWKYCVFAPEKEGGRDPSSRRYVERHLYDLASDPYELVNLVGRREYREVAEELRERLKRLMVEAGEEEPEIVEAKYYP